MSVETRLRRGRDTDTGTEWIDLATVRYEHDAAREQAYREPRHAAWKARNPLVRIGRFELREVAP